MAESWRWIDRGDGRHMLVEGKELLPVARVVLECGDVDAADQDLIVAAPGMLALLERVDGIFVDFYADGAEFTGPDEELWRSVRGLIARARGKEVPGAG